MYGGVYSSYGGSGYGSYGGMGSYGSMGGLNRNIRGTADSNNLQGQKGEEQDPQKSSRKMVFEEWFKMMGGLRSIIELGFAFIAVANFYTHISSMAKKLAETAKHMLGGMFNFLKGRVGGNVQKLKNPRTLQNVILNFVRVFSVVLIVLAAKLKEQIRRDSQEQLDKLKQELQQIKKDNIELVEVNEEQMLREEEQPELLQENASL